MKEGLNYNTAQEGCSGLTAITKAAATKERLKSFSPELFSFPNAQMRGKKSVRHW